MVNDSAPNDLLGVISATEVMPDKFPVTNSYSNWIDRAKDHFDFILVLTREIKRDQCNRENSEANPKGRNVPVWVPWNFVANVQECNKQNDWSDPAGVNINNVKDLNSFISSRWL